MPHKSLTFILLILFLCTGCEKYFVTIKKEPIDRQYLASSFVGSPDPLQQNPPLGQILFVEWAISSEDLAKKPHLALELIYGNWTGETILFDIDKRRGIAEYNLKGKPYKDKEGFFSYRALIKTPQGEVLEQWSEQMWTPLIQVDED